MRFIVVFVTAVCVLFLITKFRWPMKKNFYETEYLAKPNLCCASDICGTEKRPV